MRGARALHAALAAIALAAAAPPALAAPEPEVRLSEERGLVRHEPTGIVLPESLAEVPRAGSFPGRPAVVIYARPGSGDDAAHRFAIAVGSVKAAPALEQMRSESRRQAGGGAALEILFEGPFDWPGHADARTFRGSYVAGKLRKQYWHAWTPGYGITVMVEWARDEAEQIAKIEAAVAAQVFGGAAPGR